MTEMEVRRLKTRDSMWVQLSERQRGLARALRAEATTNSPRSTEVASTVSQLEEEVAWRGAVAWRDAVVPWCVMTWRVMT